MTSWDSQVILGRSKSHKSFEKFKYDTLIVEKEIKKILEADLM